MKKKLFNRHTNRQFFLILLFLAFACFSAGAQITFKWGDVDGNGTVNVIDALLVAQYSVGAVNTLVMPAAADVDGNGQVTIIDALLIAQYSVGAIQQFPVETKPSNTPTPSVSRTPGITGPYNSVTPTPPGPKPSADRSVSINTPFVISYGETVALNSFGALFTFKDVNDSRCPQDVVCVWEGEAVISLDIWTSGYLGELQLKAPPANPSNGGKSDPGTAYFYYLECTAVDPYPVYNNPVPKSEYRATLICRIAVP